MDPRIQTSVKGHKLFISSSSKKLIVGSILKQFNSLIFKYFSDLAKTSARKVVSEYCFLFFSCN